MAHAAKQKASCDRGPKLFDLSLIDFLSIPDLSLLGSTCPSCIGDRSDAFGTRLQLATAAWAVRLAKVLSIMPVTLVWSATLISDATVCHFILWDGILEQGHAGSPGNLGI